MSLKVHELLEEPTGAADCLLTRHSCKASNFTDGAVASRLSRERYKQGPFAFYSSAGGGLVLLTL
jgi:hypothetical protein